MERITCNIFGNVVSNNTLLINSRLIKKDEKSKYQGEKNMSTNQWNILMLLVQKKNTENHLFVSTDYDNTVLSTGYKAANFSYYIENIGAL